MQNRNSFYTTPDQNALRPPGCQLHGEVSSILDVHTRSDWQFTDMMTSTTARMALNYKQIPYRTEWLKFDEVGEKIKDL
jgi:hypothetical protein